MRTFRRGHGPEALPSGLYEDVLTESLQVALESDSRISAQRARLSGEDSVDALTGLISQAARLALEAQSGETALERRVSLAGKVLQLLQAEAPQVFRPGETAPTDGILLSISRPNDLGLATAAPKRPATALTRSELFTNSERHSVVQELASEIASADRIDLICAFIKWSGFIKFRDALAVHCRSGRELRVLTTTYLGATDARAVEELERLGARVRVSYEETPTRLHAKAWLFTRHSGLSTAYVGSSNLSRAALTEGLEWNVRVAAAELPRIVEKFEAVFRSFFDTPWASELRLWEAIDRQILVPFNYFAIDDGTDVSGAWRRGRYLVSELSNVYTADHAWLDRVARAVATNVRAPDQMRAIAFCVDVRHAELAASLLGRKLGLRAEALTASTPTDRRAALLRDFAGSAPSRPRILCVVDLLNEGVDVPAVDTLLLMRPTESATLFIQQLGRGLRRAPGKDALTVLDFIGLQHDNFRFDVRYTGLLGTSTTELQRALKAEVFPRLPSGCAFHLESRPREQVLRALQRSLRLDLRGLAARLDPETDAGLGLEPWLQREQLTLPVVFNEKRSWGEIRERTGFAVPGVSSSEEKAALEKLQRLVHVDDAWRLQCLRALCQAPTGAPRDERERRLVQMFGVVLFGSRGGSDASRVIGAIQGMPRLRWELEQLVTALDARSRVLPRPPSARLPADVPLQLHARYLTEELTAAFDLRTQEGLLYRPQQGAINLGRFDLLLVTLDKKSKSAMPHLQYEDYAISPSLFHWESQASTRRDDSRGRRHLGEEVTPLLCVREVGKDDRGLGVPYRYLGPVQRVDDEGERPIRITWRLVEGDLPADLLQRSRSAVA